MGFEKVSYFHACDNYTQVQVICMHPPLDQSHFMPFPFQDCVNDFSFALVGSHIAYETML